MKFIAYILTAITIIWSITISFSSPELTQTQLFLDYWQHYVVQGIIIIIAAFTLVND